MNDFFKTNGEIGMKSQNKIQIVYEPEDVKHQENFTNEINHIPVNQQAGNFSIVNHADNNSRVFSRTNGKIPIITCISKYTKKDESYNNNNENNDNNDNNNTCLSRRPIANAEISTQTDITITEPVLIKKNTNSSSLQHTYSSYTAEDDHDDDDLVKQNDLIKHDNDDNDDDKKKEEKQVITLNQLNQKLVEEIQSMHSTINQLQEKLDKIEKSNQSQFVSLKTKIYQLENQKVELVEKMKQMPNNKHDENTEELIENLLYKVGKLEHGMQLLDNKNQSSSLSSAAGSSASTVAAVSSDITTGIENKMKEQEAIIINLQKTVKQLEERQKRQQHEDSIDIKQQTTPTKANGSSLELTVLNNPNRSSTSNKGEHHTNYVAKYKKDKIKNSDTTNIQPVKSEKTKSAIKHKSLSQQVSPMNDSFFISSRQYERSTSLNKPSATTSIGERSRRVELIENSADTTTINTNWSVTKEAEIKKRIDRLLNRNTTVSVQAYDDHENKQQELISDQSLSSSRNEHGEFCEICRRHHVRRNISIGGEQQNQNLVDSIIAKYSSTHANILL